MQQSIVVKGLAANVCLILMSGRLFVNTYSVNGYTAVLWVTFAASNWRPEKPPRCRCVRALNEVLCDTANKVRGFPLICGTHVLVGSIEPEV